MIVEPILEMGEIQGNIFPGFMKNHQTLLGLKILKEPENILLAKAWLTSITPKIATAAEVFKFKELRNLMINRRGYLSGSLAVCWINIAFSVQGLKKLLANPTEVDQFADKGFKHGLPARATSIGDPDDTDNLEGSPKNWRIGGTLDTIPDIFLIIASDLPTQLEATVEQIKKSLKQAPTSGDEPTTTSGLEIIYEESGENLPDELSGHEHFGFKDGISQPGIRGRVSEAPDSFLTPRYIDPKDELSQLFSQPGQPLVWPGQFVFGYDTQSGKTEKGTGRPKTAPNWAKNGSFLVFRRLRQDVGLFWKTMQSKAKELADNNDGFGDLDGERLAALLVGRWKSGAPIMRTPDGDNKDLAKDNFANNHFKFREASQQIPLTPGQPDDGYELAPGDRDGFRCPHAAHIRKVNPRDSSTEQGPQADTLTRRILRRGIPFGKVLDDPKNPDVDPLKGNRGLLFLSYQTSIVDQFEFLSSNWMNAEDAPEANANPGGQDLIVGQNSPTRQRSCTIRRKVNGQTKEAKIEVETDWIIPTGGGYFFSPSITTLKEVLGAS
jgi:Dyp-type peroxidase family